MKKFVVVTLALLVLLAGVFCATSAFGNTDGVTIEKSEFSGVTMITPSPTPKTYGPPIPEVIRTPAPTVVPTSAPTVAPVTTTVVSVQEEKEWWEPFVQESASLLYEEVLGTCLDNKEQVATFAWVIREEDLEKLVEGEEYVELTQHVNYWNEYSLPQNSLGVLSVEKDAKPEGWVSKMAGSFASETSVSEEGILQKWRVGISSDVLAMKVVKFKYNPMVVVLRMPDPISGQQYFLVVDDKENKPVVTGTSGVGVQQQPTGDTIPDHETEWEPIVTPDSVPEYNQKPTPSPEYNDKPTSGGQTAPEYNDKPSSGNNGDYSQKPGGDSHQVTQDDMSGAGPRY